MVFPERPPLTGWWLAIRPKTLPASAAGVVTGSALAWADHSFRLLPALAALAIALLLQIGSNLANDVYDFERGADAARLHGPTRAAQAGLLTPGQMKRGLWVVFGLAGMLGLYLAALRGWLVIVLGAAAITSALAYTAGPFPLGYHGLGDLFVFLFFGLMSVMGTYYVQTGAVSRGAIWMSIPIGLIVTSILVVNNLRDIEEDRAAGKWTMAVRLGAAWSRVEYLSFMAVAYVLIPVLIWRGILPWTAVFAWLSLPLAAQAARTVMRNNGRPLNAALAGTGRTALLYAVLFFVGLMLGSG